MQGKNLLYCVAFLARFLIPGSGSSINLKTWKSWKLQNASELESGIRNPAYLQDQSESFGKTLHHIFQNGLSIGAPMLESRYNRVF